MGFAWIVGVIAYLVLATAAPIAWKIAWLGYGGIGLVDMAGIWQGREEDPLWSRRMRRLRWVGFFIASGLFVLGAVDLSESQT